MKFGHSKFLRKIPHSKRRAQPTAALIQYPADTCTALARAPTTGEAPGRQDVICGGGR